MRFKDRADAGRRLAAVLSRLELLDPVVLALPRGGVPVGFEIAAALNAPLDVFVVRKVGAPGHPEFGIGAIAEGGALVAHEDALRQVGLSLPEWDQLVLAERAEVERRVECYRGKRPLLRIEGRPVILVDDGLATGATAEAALRALRAFEPSLLVLAVPTASPQTAARLAVLADDVVFVIAPRDFSGVGQWYDEFAQTSDEEVVALLARAATTPPP